MKATVTTKGQITIPAAIRARMGIEKGTVLHLAIENQRIIARKAVDRAQMLSVIGLGAEELKGKSSDEWIDELRGTAELPRKNH